MYFAWKYSFSLCSYEETGIAKRSKKLYEDVPFVNLKKSLRLPWPFI